MSSTRQLIMKRLKDMTCDGRSALKLFRNMFLVNNILHIFFKIKVILIEFIVAELSLCKE